MRETAAFCHACGQVIADAGILFSEQGDQICARCAPSVPTAADLTCARLVFQNARLRQRRRARIALSALWLVAGAFAALSIRTMAPVFIIDSPASGSGVTGDVRVTGRVAVPTIGEPVWLFVGSYAAGCTPIQKVPIVIAPDGRWQSRVELKGPRGARFWLTAVLSDETGRVANDDESQEIPDWLTRHTPEEQGGRGCRRRSRAHWHPPRGATVLATIKLTLTENHGLDELPEMLNLTGIFGSGGNLSNDLPQPGRR